MSMKDLRGKTVFDLEKEDFEQLYCQHCEDGGICVKDLKTITICKNLIDTGAWDTHFRKRQD